MSKDPVDVLIIGAGASGAALAWSLSETRMSILCLEQGDWPQIEKYPNTLPDWERYRYGGFSSDPNIRKWPEDYPINNSDSPITPLNYNGVGGGTVLYMAHFPRLHPSDFRTRTLDGVGDDWPIDYQTLEPFFAINDRIMGVSGLSGNPAYPHYDTAYPPVPLGAIGRTLAKGFNKLGWHWWPSDSAILTRDQGGRKACVNAGPCDLGCASGSKGSVDITYWPRAIHRGVRLKTRCRVSEITVGKNGMADGVLYFDEGGNQQRQEASLVVVACNGIGTPRLLLNSRSNQFPDGLANRSGLVGKNLMFHPLTIVTGFFDHPMEGYKGPRACSITSHEFYETDKDRDFVRGYMLTAGRSVGPLMAAVGGLSDDRPIPWGAAHRDAMDSGYDHKAALVVVSEDLPEENNRVMLDSTLTDSDGIPAPKVIYRQGEDNKRMHKHGQARAREVIEAAGALRIFTDDTIMRPTGWHLLGTARMGTDPEKSVVNPWGRSHDVKNLFIIDGSVFVTAGAVNPTSTIQAIALYIGDRIKRNPTRLFD